MFGVLGPGGGDRGGPYPGEEFALGAACKAELFLVPGKLPLYLEGDNPDTASETAANVGVEISDGVRRLIYVPGAASVTRPSGRGSGARTRSCSTARCSPTTR